jgi:hypothetical protein
MPPAKKATARLPEKVRATQDFAVDVDGDPMIVHKGEVVSVRHAVVKGHEHLFEPTAADAHVDHE